MEKEFALSSWSRLLRRVSGFWSRRTMLEIGAYFGADTQKLARRGAQVIALDLQPGGLSIGKREGRIRLAVQADEKALPFRDSAVDTVFFANCLANISLKDDEEILRAITEGARVSQRKVFICTDHFPDGGPRRLNGLTPEGIRQGIETAGFSISRIKAVIFPENNWNGHNHYLVIEADKPTAKRGFLARL